MCLPCSKPFGWRAAYSAGNWRHLPTGCSAYGPTKMRVGFIKVNHNGWWICKLPKCCCDRWRLDFPICHRGVRPSPPSRSTRSSTSWTRFQLPTCNACTLKPTRSLSTVQTESRALGIDPRHLPIPLVASEWQLVPSSLAQSHQLPVNYRRRHDQHHHDGAQDDGDDGVFRQSCRHNSWPPKRKKKKMYQTGKVCGISSIRTPATRPESSILQQCHLRAPFDLWQNSTTMAFFRVAPNFTTLLSIPCKQKKNRNGWQYSGSKISDDINQRGWGGSVRRNNSNVQPNALNSKTCDAHLRYPKK